MLCGMNVALANELIAEWEAQEALTLLPELTLRQRRAIVPYKKQADVERYIDGLRKAGIPE